MMTNKYQGIACTHVFFLFLRILFFCKVASITFLLMRHFFSKAIIKNDLAIFERADFKHYEILS
jgi:hypothetical protein